MNKPGWKGLLVIFLLLGMVACKNRNISSGKKMKLLSEIVENDIKFKYFSSKAKLKYSTKTGTTRVIAQIRIQESEKLWTRVTMMGFEGMRAMVTKDSVFSIMRLTKEFQQESIQYLNESFGIEIDYPILEGLVMGDIPVKDLSNVKIKQETKFFTLTEEHSAFTVTYKVDKILMRMTQLVVEDKKGTKLVANYSDFELLGEQQFAKTIDILIEQKEKDPINLTIEHNKIKLETEPLEFPFSIPENYKKVTYEKGK